MTACQAFQNNNVIPVGRARSRSAVKLRRRGRTSQNLKLMVKIQTVDLRWRRARPRGMSVESIVQVVRGNDIRNTSVFADMATPQECPCCIVVKQHGRKECGQDEFYLLTIHS